MMRTNTQLFSCRRTAFGELIRLTPIMVLILVATLYFPSVRLYGQQNSLTQIHGNTDQGVVMPQAISTLGREDAAALQEIRAYQSTVNAGSWSDMKGTGKIRLNAVDSMGGNSPKSAILQILGNHDYRLDIQMPKGPRSIRQDGAYGAVQHEDGRVKPMDARDAVNELVAFPRLLDTAFPSAGTTVIDDGMAVVDGTSLHRISVEIPMPGNLPDSHGKPAMSVTDYYFDSQTHLLVKSANAMIGLNASPERYLRVITYGDYRAVNGLEIPFQYRETLNGQVLWTLQLSDVQLNQGLSQSDFHF